MSGGGGGVGVEEQKDDGRAEVEEDEGTSEQRGMIEEGWEGRRRSGRLCRHQASMGHGLEGSSG